MTSSFIHSASAHAANVTLKGKCRTDQSNVLEIPFFAWLNWTLTNEASADDLSCNNLYDANDTLVIFG